MKHKTSGITLIALIITIIVLLILAGVTINAITGSESAMEKATEAREKDKQGTELEAIKLAVVNSVASGLDGFVDITSLKDGLNGLIQESPEDVIVGDGPWIVTSTLGRVYEINKNSIVNELTGLVLTPKSLTLKIQGNTYEEKTLTAKLIDIDGTISWSNSTDIIDITPSADGNSATIKAKKNGTETVTVSCSNGDTAECIVKVTKEMPFAKDTLVITNNVSPYVDYTDKNGNTIHCRVLYNDVDNENSTHGLQIISAESVVDIGLGTADNNYKDEEGLTELQKAKNSHYNAIESLNNIAESYNNAGLSYDARCVGSKASASIGNFTNKDDEAELYERGGYKLADENSVEDFYKMSAINIMNINKSYWLASRTISGSFIGMGKINSIGGIDKDYLFATYGETYSPSNGFRPVFLLKSNIKISGGSGTSTAPYILEAGE